MTARLIVVTFLCIVSVTGFSGISLGQPAGLVAAYSFDEGVGTIAGDSSVNALTGAITGATWTIGGRFGNALSFNGINNWVTIGDATALDLTNGMTLEAWVYPTAVSDWRSIILKERSGGLSYSLYAYDNAFRPAAFINTGGVDAAALTGSNLPVNAWTHLAATYDGATVRLYTNGTQVGSQFAGGPLLTSTLPLRIGGNAIWGEYFAGIIDEVRVYNRALTPAEIQAGMNSPIGLAPPPPPPPGPSTLGQWSVPVELGLVAVNMIYLHTGKILMYGGENHGGTSASLWDPLTGIVRPVPAPYNIFCSGHAALADGRILIVGGHDNGAGILGSNETAIFDPVSESWSSVPRMAFRRWYPSATTLPDGRVLITSGGTTCFECIADVPEIYDPRSNSWTQLTGAKLAFPYYPFIFVLPDGRILNAGAGEHPSVARTLDVAGQVWTTVDPALVDGGSAVMYRPGKVLKSGTSATTDVSNVPADATAYVLDMSQPTAAWRQTNSMAFPRAYHTLTGLPDGDVLVTGGGVTTEGKDISAAVYEAEIWSPVTESWQTMAAMSVPRLYHGTALLLADARVVAAGSGDSYGGPNQTTAQFYSPPYLFRGARPELTSAPAVVLPGLSFEIALAGTGPISSVALLRQGAVTHQFDENQRYLSLSFQQNGNVLTVAAPANPELAPPGYYMLFVLNDSGIPSIATWVRLPAPAEDTTPPSAPGTVTAASGFQSVSLSWGAATDNIAVARYNVHRSSSSGFVASVSNRIAQPSGLSYTDTGLTPGTYYYLVVAQDAAGILGPPSNQAAATALADTTAPTVSITSPVAGASLSGTVTIAATATDNHGVLGVRFRVNGIDIGNEDTTSPYSQPWDTRTAPNGTQLLTAIARDAAGNQTTSTAVTVTVSNTTVPPASSLVAAYAFKEGSGTSAGDSSGKANTGTLAGATWTTAGQAGSALSFDGINDRVNVNDSASLDLTNGMTIEAWIYPTLLSGWRTVALKETTGALVYALYAHDNAPNPAAYVRIGGVEIGVAGNSALPLNTWTHLATTYDASTLRLYVNGAEVARRAISGGIQVSTGRLRIGGNAIWGEWFKGRIDEVRIYNRALTPGEIEIDMTTPIP